MKKFKKLLTIRNIIILAVLLLLSFIVYQTKFKEKVIQVKKVSLEQQEIVKTVSASGGIESKKIANLSFATSARISNIFVDEGNFAEKGTLLASGDSTSQWQSSESAKYIRDQAILDRETYRDTYENNYEDVGGREEYERQLRKRIDAVNQYEASYQSSLSGLSNYSIYAPFGGTIVEIDKEIGEVATVGSRIVKLVDLGTLFFEALVDQEDIGILQVGQEVSINLDSYPNVEFKGVITKVPNYIPEDTENIKIDINVTPQAEYPIYYGMIGDADIVVEKRMSEKALPFEYVITGDDGKDFLWTVDQANRLKKKTVGVSLEGDLFFDLETELEGQQLVTIEDEKAEPEEGMKVSFVK